MGGWGVNSRSLFLGTVMSLMSACGGGGGASGGTSTVTTVPVATPTSTPSPAPTATANAAFRVAVGAPLVGEVIFDTNGSGILGDTVQGQSDLFTQTNRVGEFGRDAAGRLGPNQPPATATFLTKVGGASTRTGFVYGNIRAPLGSVIFSPVTTMIGVESEDAIPRNLGLSLSAAQLGAFDAFVAFSGTDPARQEIGRQVVALNLKLLAHAGYERNSGNATGGIDVWEGLKPMRAQLQAGQVDLNAATSVQDVLARSSRAAMTSSAGRAAAAQLLARYGQAVDRYLIEPGRAADIEYGFRLIVIPAVTALFDTSFPQPELVARVQAITVDDLVASFGSFAGIPRLDGGAGFVAVVDRLRSNGLTQEFFTGPQLAANDIAIQPGIGTDLSVTTVTAVRVPPQFAGQFTVTLATDGTIAVRRLGPVSPFAWFDYDVTYRNSATSSARAYFSTDLY